MENYWVVTLAASVLAMLGIAWQYRSRGVKRWRKALDAYAEREIAEQQRRKCLKRPRTFSTALAVSSKVRLSATRAGQFSNKARR